MRYECVHLFNVAVVHVGCCCDGCCI